NEQGDPCHELARRGCKQRRSRPRNYRIGPITKQRRCEDADENQQWSCDQPLDSSDREPLHDGRVLGECGERKYPEQREDESADSERYYRPISHRGALVASDEQNGFLDSLESHSCVHETC